MDGPRSYENIFKFVREDIEEVLVDRLQKEVNNQRRIKRQRGRQRSSLIFWLFGAPRGGGRGYCETKF